MGGHNATTTRERAKIEPVRCAAARVESDEKMNRRRVAVVVDARSRGHPPWWPRRPRNEWRRNPKERMAPEPEGRDHTDTHTHRHTDTQTHTHTHGVRREHARKHLGTKKVSRGWWGGEETKAQIRRWGGRSGPRLGARRARLGARRGRLRARRHTSACDRSDHRRRRPKENECGREGDWSGRRVKKENVCEREGDWSSRRVARVAGEGASGHRGRPPLSATVRRVEIATPPRATSRTRTHTHTHRCR